MIRVGWGEQASSKHLRALSELVGPGIADLNQRFLSVTYRSIARLLTNTGVGKAGGLPHDYLLRKAPWVGHRLVVGTR